MEANIAARVATEVDRDEVVSIVSDAFELDPLWSLAMAKPSFETDHHRLFWQAFVDGALRFPWVWLTKGGEATSIWIPPNGTEMSKKQENNFAELVVAQLGSRAETYFELLRRMSEAHPRQVPHYYLSLLGTSSASRGRGLGMSLLAHDLAIIDSEGFPAYLESSNPANDHRYASVGFKPVGEIAYPGAGPRVTTMWRNPR